MKVMFWRVIRKHWPGSEVRQEGMKCVECVSSCELPLWAKKVRPSGQPWEALESAPQSCRTEGKGNWGADSPNPHPRCCGLLPEALAQALQVALPGPPAKAWVFPGDSR